MRKLIVFLLCFHNACATADILGKPDHRSACIEWVKYAAVGANSQDQGRPLVLKIVDASRVEEFRRGNAIPNDGIYFFRPADVSQQEADAEWSAVQEGYAWGAQQQKELGLHAWQVPDEMLWQMLFPICMSKSET